MNDINRVLDAIATRAETATPGPWEYVPGGQWVHAPDLSEQDEATEVAQLFDEGRDGPFIAHARQDIPWLIAALRAVLAVHQSNTLHDAYAGHPATMECIGCENEPWPCPTVAAITNALEASK